MRLRALLVPILLVGVTAGCASDPDIVGAGRPAPTTTTRPDFAPDLTATAFDDLTGTDQVVVDAVDNRFRAPYIEVSAGTTITFENKGRTAHDVLPVFEDAFPEIGPTDLPPEAEATIVLDEPGDYAYYCSLHGNTLKGMVGAIRVVA